MTWQEMLAAMLKIARLIDEATPGVMRAVRALQEAAEGGKE